MGIRFFCPHCDRRLHVKDYLAGRRGICPHCDEPIVIPDAAAAEATGIASGDETPAPSAERSIRGPVDLAVAKSPASQSSDVAASAADFGSRIDAAALDSGVAIELQMAAEVDDPLDAAPHLHWCVRPVAGGQYGAKGSVFKTWLQEGRIAADDHVWQEGWDQWRLAGEVFPALSASVVGTESRSAAVSSASAKTETRGTPATVAKPRVEETVTQLDRTRERLLDYRLNRSRSRGREWVAVLVLGLVCVALVSALVWLVWQRQ